MYVLFYFVFKIHIGSDGRIAKIFAMLDFCSEVGMRIIKILNCNV